MVDHCAKVTRDAVLGSPSLATEKLSDGKISDDAVDERCTHDQRGAAYTVRLSVSLGATCFTARKLRNTLQNPSTHQSVFILIHHATLTHHSLGVWH